MDELKLPAFKYYLDETDPDIVVLRRQDDAFVAAFSARGVTREGILEAAMEDYRALFASNKDSLEHLAKPSSQPAATLPGMGKQLVSDELWEAIEPLLPPEPPKPRGGRPRVPNRAVLAGIVFVLKSGIPWQMLPQEMGCGSGSTCWRRLKEWHEAGVWEKLHGVLLDRLGEANEID